MWLILRTAWRNLFRQKRRTALTVTAMAFSLAMAIPTYGLVLGMRAELLKGITGLELGHLQVHDRAYPAGRALQSTLQRPAAQLTRLRHLPGVAAAAARVHGYGLAARDRKVPLGPVGLGAKDARLAPGAIRFGRAPDPRAPWRTDVSRACEVVTDRDSAERFGINVGTVLEPEAGRQGGGCERLRVVGLLRAPLAGPPSRPGGARAAGPGPGSSPLGVLLPEVDRARTFGASKGPVNALIRSAAPVAITGVEPTVERQITFLADRMVAGRYLGPKAAGEVVVGRRLADTLRLRVGDPLFVQAASLDVSTGAFYQNFRVVGIFRTGVDGVDRTRVFIHLEDARRMMALGRTAHELVVRVTVPAELSAVKERVVAALRQTPLRVTTTPTGLRAGSQPLPAPAVVFEPGPQGARLLEPDALRLTLERVAGVAVQGRRVYGAAPVRPARTLAAWVVTLPFEGLRERLGGTPLRRDCGVYLEEAAAKARGIAVGATFLRLQAEEDECATLKVVGLLPTHPPAIPGGVSPAAPGRGAPQAAARKAPPAKVAPPPPGVLVVVPALPETRGDPRPPPPAGALTLLAAGAATPLRFVGVELSLEPRLSGLAKRVVQGKYPTRGAAAGEATWPALFTAVAAKRLGLRVGDYALVATRDEDGRAGTHGLRVAGLLGPGAAGEPELVLPYFEAQQVDAPRLNARGHEIALLPAPGVTPAALAEAVRAQLVPLVRTWDEIAPQMKQMTDMQDTFMTILLLIIFIVAATTVMNTMLMAVFERTREFGVMKSLGMRPRQVFGLIVMETLLIALIAVVVGGGLGTALDHHLAVDGLDLSGVTGGFTAQGTFINPVWKAVLSLRGVLVPMLLVSLVCLAVSFYPAYRAGRLKPVEAFRHHG